MADVNKSILTALEAGYDPQEIMLHIRNSDDPSHQEWLSNYTANMMDRAKEPSIASVYYNDGSGVVSQENKTTKPSSVSTPLLDFAKNLTPAELAAAGLTTIAAIKGPGLYNAYQDRKIEKEKLSIEQRRLNAYEQQVTKQGMTPEPVTTVAGQPQGDKLSPLDEARIATERAKAEHIQSKIAIAERAATLKEEQAKARASKQPTTGVATAPTGIAPPTGPTPTNPTVPLTTEVGKAPKEMPMVEQGLANKEINAVAEGRKQEELKPVEPPKKAPKAKTPMPEGWGKGMTWLVNQHGVEGAQDFIDRYNNGKPFASHDQMEARRQEVTMRPKFSDIPKSVRKERGISTAVVPPLPPSGGGMGVAPRTGGGGRLNETGRPGEEIIHNLNPLKL
jgi:hypothetical protein